ncbi:MAG: DUF4190 domain-containing protein [Planctomycetales bacterium]|nr:DUF4190 domain-containing protein [Planctomycetales bacterium]
MSTEARKPCPMCGEMIVASAIICRFCGETVDKAHAAPAEQGDATGGVIPYKNAPALIAYYCGVFSIIPCFPIGIVALVLGIMGLKKAKQNPLVRGQVHAWIGIIVGGLFGLLYLVGTLFLFLTPFFAGR